MRVDQIMSHEIRSCRPEDSLERAAQLMWERDCGCIPVCTGNGASRTVGVITDRDICMSALFQGKPLRELSVSEAMGHEVLTCRTHDSLAQAEKVMQERRIRRLPVVDDQGALVGMLSLADIARQAWRDQTRPRREITEVEVNETLAAICQPHGQAGTA